MVSRLEYPRLSRSEIVAFLKEYQIIPSVTEYQLAHPDSDIVSHPRVNQLAFYNHLSSSLLRAITMGSNRVYGVFIYGDQQNHRAMSSMKKASISISLILLLFLHLTFIKDIADLEPLGIGEYDEIV